MLAELGDQPINILQKMVAARQHRTKLGLTQQRTEHVVVATGADPIVPPVPGLAELDGVWGTREATSMKEVPRRLLVLGGGSAGVELAQVVRRLGGVLLLTGCAQRSSPQATTCLHSRPFH